ncbi:gamma carbonic anhydrase family protein [Acanthopleuribacter pedis]|uniref:Gamma carbonic anhydrase family protein n=1 Tax=Acanthopleuribacter pedis TaxID=442870 RepID=A0A8J7QED1_9BACT|nr:gamma carbonic anhydrase family protein [Acanthopleuribacter pedis]MBO1323052.1 gamma carbonic anhydrase family protein [Acanthopleuribacter pedis]
MQLSLPHLAQSPEIPESCYVDISARINGDVVFGEQCSIWFHVAIRGDVHQIRVGKRTNVQDHCTFHTSFGMHPLTIGDDVTFGHHVLAHGCTIENRVLVGMHSTVMDGAVIGHDSMIGAGSLVTEGKHFPPGVLILGRPAKVVRELTEKEKAMLIERSQHYVAYAAAYQAQGQFTTWADNLYRREAEARQKRLVGASA